jgi:hypothetical protein
MIVLAIIGLRTLAGVWPETVARFLP